MYGLALIRTKSTIILLKNVASNQFSNGEYVPDAEKTEYWGGHAKVDPMLEIRKRLLKISYVLHKLREFWRDGPLSKKEQSCFTMRSLETS